MPFGSVNSTRLGNLDLRQRRKFQVLVGWKALRGAAAGRLRVNDRGGTAASRESHCERSHLARLPFAGGSVRVRHRPRASGIKYFCATRCTSSAVTLLYVVEIGEQLAPVAIVDRSSMSVARRQSRVAVQLVDQRRAQLWSSPASSVASSTFSFFSCSMIS